METIDRFKKLGQVKTIQGSILSPHYAGLRLVLSVNNLAGKPENPLFPIFEKKWRQVKQDSRGWFANKTGAYKLGAVNTSAVQSDVWVMHMLCQDENLVTDLKGLETCLKEITKIAIYEKGSVHISSLLVELIPELPDLVEKIVVKEGVNVNYYQD